jgi:hypothetical protein
MMGPGWVQPSPFSRGGGRAAIALGANDKTAGSAIIVSLLIAIRTGSKMTKRTLETIQFYLLG